VNITSQLRAEIGRSETALKRKGKVPMEWEENSGSASRLRDESFAEHS
jgi:hypothetical protein